jgi:hypothetical protein
LFSDSDAEDEAQEIEEGVDQNGTEDYANSSADEEQSALPAMVKFLRGKFL